MAEKEIKLLCNDEAPFQKKIMTEKTNDFDKGQQNDETERSSAVFQNYREVLPAQFIDQVFYSYVLCKYGDEGEELLDKISGDLDNKLREVIHEYFTALDELSMDHLKPLLER